NGGLLLSIPDQGFNTDVYTDANGKFRFTNLEFLDSARVTINARGNDNYRNMVIHMDQTTLPAIDRGKWREDHLLNIEDFMNTYLNHAKRVYRNDIVLEAVEVENKTVVRSHREYSSLSGLSMPDHQVKPERLKGCTNLIFCLQ